MSVNFTPITKFSRSNQSIMTFENRGLCYEGVPLKYLALPLATGWLTNTRQRWF